MPLVSFGLVASLPGPGDGSLTGISDLCMSGSGSGAVLYVTNGAGGQVTAYQIVGGTFVPLDAMDLPNSGDLGISSKIEIIPSNSGNGTVVVTGIDGRGIWTASLDAQGALNAKTTIGGSANMPDELTMCQYAEIDGKAYIYGVRLGSDKISVWRVEGNGALTEISDPGASRSTSFGPGLVDFDIIEVGGTTFIIGASTFQNEMVLFEVMPNGVPVEVDTISALEGIGFSSGSAIEAVMVGGHAYGVMAASVSGSLTVVEITADGMMVPTDHVLDSLDTRFQGVGILESITIDGRVYLAASGMDDGLSLFELLPDGRLIHLGAVADQTNTTLNNISSISLAEAADGSLDIFVSSQLEPGITWLNADLPASGTNIYGTGVSEQLTGTSAADLIDGGAAHDTLRGGGGDDLLMDGAGSDTLYGGAGADTFVMAADGDLDRINDFQLGQDTIDLSAWEFLRTTAQLTIISTPDGAEIRYGDEVLRIKTMDGSSLSVAQVQAMNLINATHISPGWVAVVTPPQALTGTGNGDTLVGGDYVDSISGIGGNDSIVGGYGADILEGGAGDDTIKGGNDNDMINGGKGYDLVYGGAGEDEILGVDGMDSLYGGNGDDTLYGGNGDDFLDGEAGHDLIFGGKGFDRLEGGSGDDWLEGKAGYDTLLGEDGADQIYGNAGADKLKGGKGDDLLAGGINFDTLYGEDGNDRLDGNDGHDTLYGQAGDDTLYGNAGDDTLDGGNGNDVLGGGIGFDTLLGNNGHDTLNGNDGFDVLFGGKGNDTLYGNAGDDTLDGGANSDTLHGGKGADVFIFNGGKDTILDFQNDIDTLLLDSALWGGDVLTPDEMLTFAKVQNGNIVFEFSSGDKLIIDDISQLSALLNDLGMI